MAELIIEHGEVRLAVGDDPDVVGLELSRQTSDSGVRTARTIGLTTPETNLLHAHLGRVLLKANVTMRDALPVDALSDLERRVEARTAAYERAMRLCIGTGPADVLALARWLADESEVDSDTAGRALSVPGPVADDLNPASPYVCRRRHQHATPDNAIACDGLT